MIYIGYNAMTEAVKRWSRTLPRDIDAVCAVPRSGMIPASVLALHRNVKLTTLAELATGRPLAGGDRSKQLRNPIEKVLVLDDSVNSGKAMLRAKDALKHLDVELVYGALYVKPGKEHLVDYHYESVPLPRIFEWNVYHGYWAERACFDIDGVLCRDPTQEENDDGPRYAKFLRGAEPNIIPTVTVGAVVTSRLSKYRPQTEDWLKRNRVRYRVLHMHPARSKKERIRAGNHALLKAEIYKKSGMALFVESSRPQAISIAKLTKKPVLCTDTNELLRG